MTFDPGMNSCAMPARGPVRSFDSMTFLVSVTRIKTRSPLTTARQSCWPSSRPSSTQPITESRADRSRSGVRSITMTSGRVEAASLSRVGCGGTVTGVALSDIFPMFWLVRPPRHHPICVIDPHHPGALP
jgi:hypothetical protein